MIIYQVTALNSVRKLRRSDWEFAATGTLRTVGTDNLLGGGPGGLDRGASLH